MKIWKRLGAVLTAVLVLTSVMVGPVMAAEAAAPEISVQLNGENLAFTDAAPEGSNGRVFIPLRAVMEAMDAQVDYDRATDTVMVQRGGTELSMVLGGNKASIREDGQTRTLEMDVAPYVKNDRTYVPVRFVAEAFGCNVGWDQSAQTVIIIDVDALLGDASFTLMDNFSAYCQRQGTSDNMAVAGTLALDIKDTSGLYLPKPVSAKGSIEGVSSETGVQLSWELQISGLSDLLADAAGSPMEQILMQQLAASLSNLKGEVRMDLEKAVYLTLPAELTGAEADTWYSLDLAAYQAELLNGLDMTQLTQLQNTDIREILTLVLQSVPLDDSAASYDMLAEVVSVYTDLLSDQAFTQKGSSYVSQIKLEDIADMTVTLTKRGDDIVSADVLVSCDMEQDGDKFTLDMNEHAAPDKVTVDMEAVIQVEGMDIALNLDLDCVPTSKAPVTTPPAGAVIVPMA